MKLTSNHIKASLLHYFRFQRSMVVATEVESVYNSLADILVYDENNIIEVEVKINKQDLLNEVNKRKHTYIFECFNKKVIPNKFYFCVPDYLLDDVEKFVEELNPKYGILLFERKNTKMLGKYISVVRQAKKLHNENIDFLRNKIVKRLCSELCNFYSEKYNIHDD